MSPTYCDVRWQCRGCGRFVAQDAINEMTRIDPTAYYGVAEEMWIDCAACGSRQDVLCVAIKEVALLADFGEER